MFSIPQVDERITLTTKTFIMPGIMPGTQRGAHWRISIQSHII